MADKTYRDALAANELVPSGAGVNQENIDGTQVISATGASPNFTDSGFTFDSLKSWIKLDADWMSKSVYDTNGNGLVNGAETIDDGAGNSKTAVEVAVHIDDLGIHRELNDAATTTTNLWSASKIDGDLSGKVDNSSFTSHVGDFNNPHQVSHSQLPDGGTNAHTVIDAHLAIGGATPGNPHGVTHAILSDAGANTHAQIDAHIASTSNPHVVTAAQAGAAPASHVLETVHLDSDERAAMDNVSQPLNAGNPFATMADVGGGGGIPEPADDAYGYLRRGSTSNDWQRGSRVFEQATAPTTPSIGDVWIDTS